MCVCAYEFVYAIQRVYVIVYVCSFISMGECAYLLTGLYVYVYVCVCVCGCMCKCEYVLA